MLIKTVRILCVRDSKTKISATVAEHELPILKLIHGEGNVIEQPDIATRPCEIEPEDEADRLSQKYGQEALFAAYGRLAGQSLKNALAAAEVKTKAAEPKKAAKTGA